MTQGTTPRMPARYVVPSRNAGEDRPVDGNRFALDVLLRQYSVGDRLDLSGL